MKTPILISVFSWMLLLITSCSDQESIQRPTLSQQPIQPRDGDVGAMVCNLIQLTYDVLNSTETSLSDWIDPNFFYLADLNDPTGPQISQMHSYIHEAIQNMSAENEDFESAFIGLLGANLSHEEFDSYAAECSISRETRWCLFCSSTACGNSITIEAVGLNTSSPEVTLVGLLGQWIHCNH